MSKRPWVGLLLPFAVLGSLLVGPAPIAATAAPVGTPSSLGGDVAPASSAGQVCSVSGPAGVDWTSRTSAANQVWRSVTWGGPPGQQLFVAVAETGSGSDVMTSPDGITWTSRTQASNDSWRSVTWANGIFVAVAGAGGGSRIMTSPDGITWTSRTSPTTANWNSVVWGDDTFVAVASSGTRAMTSHDGVTWTQSASVEALQWRSVTWGDDTFVAVAQSGSNQVMTSLDGVNWTARAISPTSEWRSVTWGGPPGQEKFVAVAAGVGEPIMTSRDGVTWTIPPDVPDKDWFAVTWGGLPGQEVFAAVAGLNTSDTNVVMTSPDGVNWTLRQGAAANEWMGVTWGGPAGQEKFVAVARTGVGNRVMTSSAPITCLAVRVPPGPPREVAASAILNGALVTWSPPEDPGTDDINLYAVRAWPGGPVCQVPASALSCNVSGLDPTQDYYFTVVAMSGAGWGSASQPSNTIRPVAPEPPGAPTNVVATPGDARATVTWSPPATVGSSPVREYRVASSPAGGSCASTVPDCVVTGLTNGSAYTFTVEARNDEGWGPASQASAAVTPQAPAISIQGTRSGRLVQVTGVTTSIAPGSPVTVWWRFGGRAAFAPSVTEVRVDQTGSFTWQRRMNPAKRVEAYATVMELQSNTIVLQAKRSL